MSDRPNAAIYLDNAATSFPKPECVYVAADTCLRSGGVAFGRGSHAAGDTAGQMVAVCRQRLTKLLNAESSNRIAFTFNCTDGLNLLLRGLLNDGDRVVTTTLEHNSVLRPLQQLHSERQLDVVRIGFDVTSGLVDEQTLEDQLRKKTTRLVVLNHASNVTGVVQRAQQIARLAHSAGALILLDAAQTVGHLPVDVQELGVDFLATAGHKGLLGPLGTGLVYVADGRENQLRPVRCGGTGTVSEQLEQPAAMPTKLESGNLNMPGLAGLNAAAEWLLQHSPATLHASVNEHCLRLKTGLSSIPGVTLLCGSADEPNAGVVSFTIADADSREVATILDQSFGIQCRAGLHCAPLVHAALHTAAFGGALRFSPGPFTTQKEITTAIDAVKTVTEAFQV
ncbi:MAG: aminotransferase class V-fold PLP-dependent enzyme [Planctomycetaceae bacterium]